MQLRYQLRAAMPVKVLASAPSAYLYYNPDVRADGQPRTLLVGEK